MKKILFILCLVLGVQQGFSEEYTYRLISQYELKGELAEILMTKSEDNKDLVLTVGENTVRFEWVYFKDSCGDCADISQYFSNCDLNEMAAVYLMDTSETKAAQQESESLVYYYDNELKLDRFYQPLKKLSDMLSTIEPKTYSKDASIALSINNNHGLSEDEIATLINVIGSSRLQF